MHRLALKLPPDTIVTTDTTYHPAKSKSGHRKVSKRSSGISSNEDDVVLPSRIDVVDIDASGEPVVDVEEEANGVQEDVTADGHHMAFAEEEANVTELDVAAGEDPVEGEAQAVRVDAIIDVNVDINDGEEAAMDAVPDRPHKRRTRLLFAAMAFTATLALAAMAGSKRGRRGSRSKSSTLKCAAQDPPAPCDATITPPCNAPAPSTVDSNAA